MNYPLKNILLKTIIGVGAITTTEHIGFRDELEHPAPIIFEEKIVTKEKKKKELIVEATFYGPDCRGCTGITKSGHDVRKTIYVNGYRVIAVDPRLIKLGSIVQVDIENGMSFKAIASDIGGDIKGMRIDVLVGSEKESFKYGRKKAKVIVDE